MRKADLIPKNLYHSVQPNELVAVILEAKRYHRLGLIHDVIKTMKICQCNKTYRNTNLLLARFSLDKINIRREKGLNVIDRSSEVASTVST